jgi:subtilisin family serine protease
MGGSDTTNTSPKGKKEFKPSKLWTSIISIPLNRKIDEVSATDTPDLPLPIVIDLNLDCRGGRKAAANKVARLITDLLKEEPSSVGFGASKAKNEYSDQYFFASLPGRLIRELVTRDRSSAFTDADLVKSLTEPKDAKAMPSPEPPLRVDLARDGTAANPPSDWAIHCIWPDFEVKPLINKSIRTVKADAAHRSFVAHGREIVWAVMDSGVERHPHFDNHLNLDLKAPLSHRDFTVLEGGTEDPCRDILGHGTHVAGIIAGEMTPADDGSTIICSISDLMDERGQHQQVTEALPIISGMAPECKIVSLKVLNDTGSGLVSNLIAAIKYIQEINGYGRRLLIHGVNMSVGYDFDPEWFACGQSPLCVEVNRLVRSGVVVVVAAGNTGYIFEQTAFRGVVAAGASLTINDPGNADLAITVGSTHRESPHVYGVSYFSSKGPTGDGRLKPDILGPGEKILSCASAAIAASKRSPEWDAFDAEATKKNPKVTIGRYVQQSGTSMAAPHVSGAIAAFLSIRREFVGQPEDVKRVFLNSATDLKRERYFQGSGLVDLMRAIQSV